MAPVKHTVRKTPVKGNDSDSSQKKKTLKKTKKKKSKDTSESQTKQKTESRDSRHQTSILNYTGTKGRESENSFKQDDVSLQKSNNLLDRSNNVDKKRKLDTVGGGNMSREKIRKSTLQKKAQYSPEESVLKKKTFFNHQIQTWQPLSTETLNFVQTVVDNGMNEILNKNLSLDYDDVKKKLKGLKVRLMSKLKGLNGPKNKYGDYKKLLYSKKQLQSERTKYGVQEDNIQEVLDAAEREQTLLEEENKKLERLLDKADKIHPLLQRRYTPQLDVPDLY